MTVVWQSVCYDVATIKKQGEKRNEKLYKENTWVLWICWRDLLHGNLPLRNRIRHVPLVLIKNEETWCWNPAMTWQESVMPDREKAKWKWSLCCDAEGLFVQAGAEERRKSIFRNSKGCFVYSDTRKKLLTTVFEGGIFFCANRKHKVHLSEQTEIQRHGG